MVRTAVLCGTALWRPAGGVQLLRGERGCRAPVSRRRGSAAQPRSAGRRLPRLVPRCALWTSAPSCSGPGGCCAAVRPRRFGTRMARSASAPRSGARRIFGPHRALGEPTSPRRMTPKSSTGKTKVVENLEKMLMVQVRQRAPHCTPLYPLPSCRRHSPQPHDCPLRYPRRCPGGWLVVEYE